MIEEHFRDLMGYKYISYNMKNKNNNKENTENMIHLLKDLKVRIRKAKKLGFKNIPFDYEEQFQNLIALYVKKILWKKQERIFTVLVKKYNKSGPIILNEALIREGILMGLSENFKYVKKKMIGVLKC